MELYDVLEWLKTASEEDKKEIEKVIFPTGSILAKVLGPLVEKFSDDNSLKGIKPEIIISMFTNDEGEYNDE